MASADRFLERKPQDSGRFCSEIYPTWDGPMPAGFVHTRPRNPIRICDERVADSFRRSELPVLQPSEDGQIRPGPWAGCVRLRVASCVAQEDDAGWCTGVLLRHAIEDGTHDARDRKRQNAAVIGHKIATAP